MKHDENSAGQQLNGPSMKSSDSSGHANDHAVVRTGAL